jgi:hypothetical protein
MDYLIAFSSPTRLGVKFQEVVRGEVEARSWGFKVKGVVRTVPVVMMKPGGQGASEGM